MENKPEDKPNNTEKSIVDKVESTLADGAAKTTEAASDLVKGVGGFAAKLANKVGAVADKTGAVVDKAIDKSVDAVGKVAEKTEAAVDKAIDKSVDAAGKVADKIEAVGAATSIKSSEVAEKAVALEASDDQAEAKAEAVVSGEFKKLTLAQWNEQNRADSKNKAEHVSIGDYVKLNYQVREGERERIQTFEGVVIAKKGGVDYQSSTITVRRSTKGYTVERVIPCFSPSLESIKITKKSRVRRAKLYYLRDLSGKKARLVERI